MKTLRFGGKLDIIRRAQGLTVAETASKCGVPEGTMERIILGQNSPTSGHLVRILKRLRISIDVIEPEDFEEDNP